MADVMMMLGDYAFGLDTAAFQEMNRTTQWRWPSQDVFESRPVYQFTGQGKETITLPGVIYPEYWGGTDQMQQLRDLADTGQTQTLIDGRGNLLGEFVITEVTERQSIFAQGGVGRRVEFSITLERSGGEFVAAPPVVPDLSSVAAVVTPAAPAGAGTLAGLNAAVQSAVSMAASAASKLSTLQSSLGPVTTALNAARAMQAAAATASASVRGLTGIPALVAATGAVAPLLSNTVLTMQTATGASDALGTTGTDIATIATVNQLAVTAVSINSQVRGILGGFH